MSRLGHLFIHEVNVAIAGLIVATMVGAGVHYVSVVHEIHRIRQDLCSAKLELITTRNRYLKTAVEPADTCAVLTTLTGDQRTTTPALSMRSYATTRTR
jgi:hypothetical protein